MRQTVGCRRHRWRLPVRVLVGVCVWCLGCAQQSAHRHSSRRVAQHLSSSSAQHSVSPLLIPAVDCPAIVDGEITQLQRQYPYAPPEIFAQVTQQERQKWPEVQFTTGYIALQERIKASVRQTFFTLVHEAINNASDISAEQAKERFEFRGIQLGAALQSLGEGYSCVANTNTDLRRADTRCIPIAKASIADVPTLVVWYLFFYEQLHGIYIEVDAAHFSQVVDAFTAQYGPGEHTTGPVGNRQRGSVENTTDIWRRADTTIEVTRVAGNVQTSRIIYSTAYYWKEVVRRGGDKRQKDGKEQ